MKKNHQNKTSLKIKNTKNSNESKTNKKKNFYISLNIFIILIFGLSVMGIAFGVTKATQTKDKVAISKTKGE